ncbi:MAG: hypothetical protein KF865_03350 [Bdellovibrionaceae bacterium]|nr:hypothetical protein [Pseudobdellovibrionaceae bacterium]
MIRKIQRRWFEVWADEEAQNRILKYLVLVLGAMLSVQLVVISVLALRGPVLIAISKEATQRLEPKEPDTEQLMRELIRAITNYLKTRHNWDWNSVEAQTKAASSYVASDFREKYLVATSEQIRVSKEKQVAQRLYPDEPKIDMKNKTAVVHAERILIVSGVRAAQSLDLEIGFSLGERTINNQEGIYITSEKLISN